MCMNKCSVSDLCHLSRSRGVGQSVDEWKVAPRQQPSSEDSVCMCTSCWCACVNMCACVCT